MTYTYDQGRTAFIEAALARGLWNIDALPAKISISYRGDYARGWNDERADLVRFFEEIECA